MNHADDRLPRGGKARQIREDGAAEDELLRLQQQVGAGTFDQLDEGQLVLKRDLLRANDLVDAPRMVRTAFYPRVVDIDDAADPRDEADPGDVAAAIDVLDAIILVHPQTGERRKLDERCVAIEQPPQALSREQLAALAEFGLRPLRRRPDLGLERPELRDEIGMRLAVGAEGRTFAHDRRLNDPHLRFFPMVTGRCLECFDQDLATRDRRRWHETVGRRRRRRCPYAQQQLPDRIFAPATHV